LKSLGVNKRTEKAQKEATIMDPHIRKEVSLDSKGRQKIEEDCNQSYKGLAGAAVKVGVL
jgi:hypothetical protein